jgi:hypothetical protein
MQMGQSETPLGLGSNDGLGAVLTGRGVFKGAHGLAGLLDAQEFWDEQPYGTRLYYGPGALDYLHRDVLRAAVVALRDTAPNVEVSGLQRYDARPGL